MLKLVAIFILIVIFQQTSPSRRRSRHNAYYLFEERKARRILEIINEASSKDENKLQQAEWNYATNLTDENLQKKSSVVAEIAERTKRRWKKLMRIKWKTLWDVDLKRQFKLYSVLGGAVLPKDDLERYEKIVGEMEKIYATNTICDFHDRSKCNLTMDVEIVEILKKSRNEKELKYVWKSWHSIGSKIKDLYTEYVTLANKIAHLNNFPNNAELWLEKYDDLNIKPKFMLLWNQIKPLYLQLHAYVRYNLRKIYGNCVDLRKPIPAHLTGNMWAQSWENIARDMLPFPRKILGDITRKLIEQNYTPTKIFKTAEDFFVSINMSAMTPEFWNNSILEKPKNRDIVCHGSAWDFSDGKDFRIKMCTTVTEDNFVIAHHEMGHIEYYMEYKNQPYPFREGANPGFHEAIGDLIALSVKSTKHLKKLQLLTIDTHDPEIELNNLFIMGMSKLPLLPYAYLLDQWRWDVFSGRTTPECYNTRYWFLRRDIQGVAAPIFRTETDFDAASKYHVVADTPYIRYFVSFIIQFQFHEALCACAGEYSKINRAKALHLCDIYGKKEAGNLLKKMLGLGASRRWPDAMEVLTGNKEMDAGPLLEYFKPLHVWLQRFNRMNGVFVGW